MNFTFYLAICGGRAYNDREKIWYTLDRIHHKRMITALVHGACPTGWEFPQPYTLGRNRLQFFACLSHQGADSC